MLVLFSRRHWATSVGSAAGKLPLSSMRWASMLWSREESLHPALGLVIAQIDDRHVSKSLDGEFAARSFSITAPDELALERFLKRMGG